MHGMCHQRHRGRSHWDRDTWYEEWGPAPRRRDRWDRVDVQGTARETQRGAVAVAEREADERVGDADRERAAALLSEAFRDGVLHIEEFDQRLSQVYESQTVSDLAAVTHDLPRDWVTDLRAAEDHERRAERHRLRWRAGLNSYLRVMTVLVAIWFFTSLGEFGTREAYFWPIWPMLGWGIPLFLSRPSGPAARTVRRIRH